MFPQLLLGGLISGALGAGKAIFGAVQASRAKKKAAQMVADRPKYNIPEEYQKSLGIYQNLAAGEMPGQKYYENLIGESTARAMTGAERGAISSNVYQGAVETAQDKELQALNNLALMGMQYKTQAQQNLAGAQSAMGQLKDVQWQTNVLQPWEIQKNIETEQRQAGMQNMFSGLGDMGSAVMNFVGTKYMGEIIKELYPQNTTNWSPFKSQSLTQAQNYSPQQNLLNTTSNLLQKTPIKQPNWLDLYENSLKTRQ